MGRWQGATARRSRRAVARPTEPRPRQARPSGSRCKDRARLETTLLLGWSVQILERLRRGMPDSPAFGGRSGPVARLATNHRRYGPPNCGRVEDIVRYRQLRLGIAGQTATARLSPSVSPGTRVSKER